MSTKIYNGYVIRTSDMREINRFCKKFQKMLVPARERLIREMWDSDTYRKNYWEIRKAVKQAEQAPVKTPFDFTADLMFFPLRTKTLIMTFWLQPYYDEYWEKMSSEYYGYWNNVDPQEGVTSRQWEQRRKDWSTALSPDYVPAGKGFMFEVFERGRLPYADELYPSVKSKK